MVGSKVQLRVIGAFVYSFIMAGIIHPLLARFFWAAGPREPLFGSPYRYCNGTYIYERDHSFFTTEPSDNLHSFIFIDFAGSGLVHLCGKCIYKLIMGYHSIRYYSL